MADGEASGSGGRRDPYEAARAEIDAVLRGTASAEPIKQLPRPEELVARDIEQDIRLKRTYARYLLGILVAQLLIANTVFIVYAWAGVDWKLEPRVINVWLAATLIEVVGIVLVVTRYLFPRRDVL
jgi:hypothetical protein